jgi:hypothetical protein
MEQLREVAVVTSPSDSLVYVVDPRTGTQLASFKSNTSLPGSAALIGGDYLISAQVLVWSV